MLRVAAALFGVGAIIHNADHLRRGISATSGGVQILGWIGIALTVAVIALVFKGHRIAPIAAIGGGFGLAVGFIAMHWLPDWGVFSDSLVDGTPEAATRVASLVEIIGALALGVAGVVVLRRRGGLAAAAW